MTSNKDRIKSFKEFDTKFQQMFIHNRNFFWEYNKKTGVPFLKKYKEKEKELTDEILQEHYHGKRTIGVSPFSSNDTVGFGVIDIDGHFSKKDSKKVIEKVREQNKEDIQILYKYFKGKGFSVICLTCVGNGYHLFIFQDNAKASEVRSYIKHVQETILGENKHEIFPKQNRLSDTPKGFGNQIKLPLAMHIKHKKQVCVYLPEEDKILDRNETGIYIKNFDISNIKNIEWKNNKTDRYDELTDTNEFNYIPENCDFIEHIAIKEKLPSAGGHPRNHYIDPNIEIYSKDKPHIKEKYLKIQEKSANSLDGWSKTHAKLNCKQINSYLLANENNPVCKKGLEICRKCRSKEFYLSDKVNFDSELKTWDECKVKTYKVSRKTYKFYFFATTNKKIVGKVIIINNNLQKITVVSEYTIKDENGKLIDVLRFIDDIVDKRKFGQPIKEKCLEFYLYQVTSDDRKTIIFSPTKLPSEPIVMKGMEIELPDSSEISKTLRLSSKTRAFFVNDFEKAIKTLSKKELISYVKEIDLSVDDFTNILFLHNDALVYRHPKMFELLMISMMLSSKYEGYPLHILMMSLAGGGKTKLLECLNLKFKEHYGINEAGNSTLKALIPSFKESPASPGYILSCFRIALVDEFLKLIENSISQINEYFKKNAGQLNMLLEQKERHIGSGNNNSFTAKSGARVFIASNPVHRLGSIEAHIDYIDNSTMSRMLFYNQNASHRSKIHQMEPLSYKHLKLYTHFSNEKYKHIIIYDNPSFDFELNNSEEEKKRMNISLGVYISILLTIYDSCQNILVDFDKTKISKIFNKYLARLQGNFKKMYEARYKHHITLLLDGIVKRRCIFIDHDETFTPKDEDYQLVDELVEYIVSSWTDSIDSDSTVDSFFDNMEG